jgi:hypothetical protein
MTKHTNPVLGAKSQLTDKPTGKDKREMGSNQYATTLLNAEVNLISDWVVEHRPESVKHNRSICCCRHILLFLYREDSNFDLAGNVVQVRDNISQKTISRSTLQTARALSLYQTIVLLT